MYVKLHLFILIHLKAEEDRLHALWLEEERQAEIIRLEEERIAEAISLHGLIYSLYSLYSLVFVMAVKPSLRNNA